MALTKVAELSEIADGRMHAVTVGDTDLLLVRIEGELRAFSGRCPHHDAPLADGLLDGTRIVCPWHQSVFSALDGSLTEPPALDALQPFDVTVDGDDVLVSIPEGPAAAGLPENLGSANAADHKKVVIVGSGAAGVAAALEMRRVGFEGRVIIVSDDPQIPYDRTQCSKLYLAGDAPADWLPLKEPSFYVENDIERIEHRVDDLDITNRRITLPGGSVVEADGLLLATGGEPIEPEIEGSDLEGVMTLRTWIDADRIAERAAKAERVVVVGASFIGMEAAAALKQRGVSGVTVVAPEQVPFERTLGNRVGGLLEEIHRAHEIDFRLGRHVIGFEGDDRVRAVRLDDSDVLEADLVVVGIGVRPATSMLTEIELEDDGSLLVDELLRVCDGVYAAGDIATFPDWRTGEPTRIEHWRSAQQQGMTAGRNLAGKVEPFRSVPFFWTMHFGNVLGYVGHAPSWNEEILHGNPDDHDFINYYLRAGRVLAAAAMGRDNQLNALHELMQLEREPTADELRDGDLDLVDQLVFSSGSAS